MRISRDSDSDPCPVPDDMLGELYRASKNGLPELIATVSPDVGRRWRCTATAGAT